MHEHIKCGVNTKQCIHVLLNYRKKEKVLQLMCETRSLNCSGRERRETLLEGREGG